MALWLQAANTAVDDLNAMGSGVMDYLKLLLVLAGILILAFVAIKYFIPRMIGLNPSMSGPIQVLARYPLEPKRTLYAIKVGSDILLIGSSENGLHLLKDLDPVDFQAGIQQIDSARTNQFAKVLANLRGRKIS